jgi:hypothetical protein
MALYPAYRPMLTIASTKAVVDEIIATNLLLVIQAGITSGEAKNADVAMETHSTSLV